MIEKSELLEALSIEELEDRNEFAAVAPPEDTQSHCVLCTC